MGVGVVGWMREGESRTTTRKHVYEKGEGGRRKSEREVRAGKEGSWVLSHLKA